MQFGDLTDRECQILNFASRSRRPRAAILKKRGISMAISGLCASVRPRATCPSETAIGTQSLCASHAGSMLVTNAKGDPLTFDVTGGEAHEVKGYDALMELHDINPDRLLGDKGYDSDDIRNDLADRGIEPVIKP